ncbi:hypothetical protein BaRGS_00006001 [Batillaria attramentaria]|uniref:Uncharacterized protein n=1 Tax=Batillaria attramentaria TaxID=370345 RepID=A0ABD0LTC2_9CAEN
MDECALNKIQSHHPIQIMHGRIDADPPTTVRLIPLAYGITFKPDEKTKFTKAGPMVTFREMKKEQRRRGGGDWGLGAQDEERNRAMKYAQCL